MRDIVLIGSGPSIAAFDPANHRQDIIWTLASIHHRPELAGVHINAYFEIHPPWQLQSPNYISGLWDWLTTQEETPIYMQEQYEQVPMSRRYALRRLPRGYLWRQESDGTHTEEHVLSSSFDWMMSAAINERPRRIWLYGFDMASDTEYKYQAVGAAYWLGVANGAQIEVIKPRTSPLVRYARRYGYEGAQMIPESKLVEFRHSINEKFLESREKLTELSRVEVTNAEQFNERERVTSTNNAQDGALQAITFLLDHATETPGGGRVVWRQLVEKFKHGFEIKRGEARHHLAFHQGILNDRKRTGDPELPAAEAAYFRALAQTNCQHGAVMFCQYVIDYIDGVEGAEVTGAAWRR